MMYVDTLCKHVDTYFFPLLNFIPSFRIYAESRGISQVFLVRDGSVKSIENGVPMVRMR